MFLQPIEDLHDLSHRFDGEIPLTGILNEMELLFHLIGQGSIAVQKRRGVVQPEEMSNVPRIGKGEWLDDGLRFNATRTNSREEVLARLSLLRFEDTESISIGQLDVTR